MAMRETTALRKINRMGARINIIQGGARAGKTVAMMIIICDLSFSAKGKTIHIVSDSYPNIENGAQKDWEDLLRTTNREQYYKVNQVKHTWRNRITGTVIKFLACDADDALGAGKDYLFINEANRINFETFNQLELRTTERIWLDFNPANEFYAHTEIMAKRNDWEFLKLTYKDNEAIPPSVLASLLQRKGDGTSNWWRVYGEGEIGSLEGNVYQGWKAVDEIPEGYVLKRYGVDFGFSNDPTAVVAVYEAEDGSICLDQKICAQNILTPKLIAELKTYPDALLVCDNARPEIIAEMQANGLRAIGSNKTPGEKMNGKRYNIELVMRRTISYTRRSTELEREFLTYAWRKKKTGEIIDEPKDGDDHCMDAIAYAIRDMERKPIEFAGIA